MVKDHRRWIAAPLVLAGLSGCTNYYYYGRSVPVLEVPAGAQPVVIQPGSVCEVPASSGALVAESDPCEVVPGGGQIIVSQPQGLRRAASGSKYAWRKPEPESMATTRVEGGIDDAAVR